MNISNPENRFDDFFKEKSYVSLKNSLYNYRLRKGAVSRHLQMQPPGAVLETGSGISPVTRAPEWTIYTDLSFQALAVLKQINAGGLYVVADCCHLPFKSDSFPFVISSEVLEHIADDQLALQEMARVTRAAGQLIVTFPHRKIYFAADDRFVDHFRRYETEEMTRYLHQSGFQVVKLSKLLGPLEKLAMLTAVTFYELFRKKRGSGSRELPAWLAAVFEKSFQLTNTFIMGPVWLEALLLPLSLASVVMIVGRRNKTSPAGQSEC